MVKVRRFAMLALAASAALAPQSAGSWGAPGHIGVGHLGDVYLQAHANAAAHVKAILGNLSLGSVAPWADCAKNVSSKGKLPTTLPSGCSAFKSTKARAEMVDFALKNWTGCYSMLPVDSSGKADKNALRYVRSNGCHRAYHFEDVPIERSDYQDGFVGTHPYDLVHALNASVAILRGESAPAPFHFTCRQALMTLVHYVGDLHQPLHVGAIYLRPDGSVIDPDSLPVADRATEAEQYSTVGGNNLLVGSGELHGKWDTVTGIPSTLAGFTHSTTPGPASGWAAEWATATFLVAQSAFKGLSFKAQTGASWPVMFDDQGQYRNDRQKGQIGQILLGGSRLGQILVSIWPDQAVHGAIQSPCGVNS
jgi:hypothetical protein